MNPSELDPNALFHLATGAEWERYRSTGSVAPASLEAEGFVHCSWGRQVAGTVAKHFGGVADLRALQLDRSAVESLLVEEDTSGAGQAFPHVYGSIPSSAVIEVHAVDGHDPG